jgi:hypothetical protein
MYVIISLGWKINYKLENIRHAQSKFGCNSYKLFHFSCIKFIFFVIFEVLLNATMWLKLPKDCKVGYQKVNCFIHKILDFYFFKYGST